MNHEIHESHAVEVVGVRLPCRVCSRDVDVIGATCNGCTELKHERRVLRAKLTATIASGMMTRGHSLEHLVTESTKLVDLILKENNL